jgi:uncharacterized membrane protein
MKTPAQIGGHPLHPMLVTIPIGLWIFSLVCDFIAGRSATPETWSAASLYAMVGGIIGALAAALPGLVDLLSLRDAPIRKTALTHMGLNLTIVALYAVNAWTRVHHSVGAGTSLALSLVAIAMLLVSGWLGGKMVFEAGVGVHTEDLGVAPAASGWSSGTTRPRGTTMAPSAFGERAMASDSLKPTRPASSMSEDRPLAGYLVARTTTRKCGACGERIDVEAPACDCCGSRFSTEHGSL